MTQKAQLSIWVKKITQDILECTFNMKTYRLHVYLSIVVFRAPVKFEILSFLVFNIAFFSD